MRDPHKLHWIWIVSIIIIVTGFTYGMWMFADMKMYKQIREKDTDTLYTYYRGEQGHISFHKPVEQDVFEPIINHSELKSEYLINELNK